MSAPAQLPTEATVFGSGAGALTIAAELGLKDVAITIADYPEFLSQLESVRQSGVVEYKCDWHGSGSAPVASVSGDPANAADGSPLLVVSVPPGNHARLAETLAPVLQDGQQVLWVGGGGALSLVAALRALGRQPNLLLGETNTLPYGGPGVGPGFKKLGGTLVAGLPSRSGPDVLVLAQLAWPWVSAAQDVWETTLVNYDAIDHVATLLCNLGSAEGRMGRMLLWGEGATPGVVNAIEAVDAELLALRDALGIGNRRRYINYIKDQGFVDEVKSSLYETIQASKLVLSPFVCGPRALESRYVTEDVPCALVLASSIGVELGVGTPLIDGLIALASAVTKTDWRVAGRSLAQWDLAGTGREGLKNAAEHGWW